MKAKATRHHNVGKFAEKKATKQHARRLIYINRLARKKVFRPFFFLVPPRLLRNFGDGGEGRYELRPACGSPAKRSKSKALSVARLNGSQSSDDLADIVTDGRHATSHVTSFFTPAYAHRTEGHLQFKMLPLDGCAVHWRIVMKQLYATLAYNRRENYHDFLHCA